MKLKSGRSGVQGFRAIQVKRTLLRKQNIEKENQTGGRRAYQGSRQLSQGEGCLCLCLEVRHTLQRKGKCR